MPIPAGSRLGPYEIVAAIGAGGMGEVYKARDTRLSRSVAIKVLPEHIAKRPELRSRFEREARAVASLNHPHICTLFDIGNQDGAGYMVMELIEGETLAGRIKTGAIPLDKSLVYAVQIADALDRAHRAGVTHRDIKPGNIMLTRDGVKVLDFGLAKSAVKPGPNDETESALTTEGIVLGTPQYMAPEQFEGKEADARSDVWAFGAVLYEMVTGQKAFQGSNYTSLVNAILTADPEPMSVKPLERLIRRCLAKDPEDRWQTMRDVVIELQSPPQESTIAVPSKPARWVWPVVGALAAALALAVVAPWRPKEPAADRPMAHLEFDAKPDETVSPAISPDGTRIVFVSRPANEPGRLMLRRIDRMALTTLPGTEGAQFPFFSPDGRSVGFFAEGRLKTLSLDGGTPTVLADTAEPGGGTWGERGNIAVAPHGNAASVLSSLPALGGPVKQVTRLGSYSAHLAPYYLPGEAALLYTVREWSTAAMDSSVYAVVPGSMESKLVISNASGARYLRNGHLAFFRQGKIYAAPFDLPSLRVTGEAVSIIEDVANVEGIPQFDVSASGTLVYGHGRGQRTEIVRVDGQGKSQTVVGDVGFYLHPSVSPDGTRIAFTETKGGKETIRIAGIAGGTSRALTLDPRPQRLPVWSPDGLLVFYDSAGKWLSVRADGAGEPVAAPLDLGESLLGFSLDGKLAVGLKQIGAASRDLWVAPVERDVGALRIGKRLIVAGGPGERAYASFSPDRRWIAHMSNESGRFQVYVISLTADGRPAGGKWQISTNAGFDPKWSAVGGQIYFCASAGEIVSVRYSTKDDSFIAEPPRQWTPRKPTSYPDLRFDMTSDGKYAIVVVDAAGDTVETHVRVVLNFEDEVRRKLARP